MTRLHVGGVVLIATCARSDGNGGIEREGVEGGVLTGEC